MENMMQTSTKSPIDWLPYLKWLPKKLEKQARIGLRMAYGYAAANSHDPSTQLGAYLVDPDWHYLAISCNRFPRNVKESPVRWERPKKYFYVEHAEREVIYTAAKYGLPTNNTILICPWFSCADCARAIIESGIDTVIGHKIMFDGTPERWHESIKQAFEMLRDAEVLCYVYDGFLNAVHVRFNGELIKP